MADLNPVPSTPMLSPINTQPAAILTGASSGSPVNGAPASADPPLSSQPAAIPTDTSTSSPARDSTSSIPPPAVKTQAAAILTGASSGSPVNGAHASISPTPSSSSSSPPPMPEDVFQSKFLRSLHEQFILSLDAHKDSFEYCATEHLKMSGVYWAVMVMDLMSSLHLMDRASIISFVKSCQHPSGGFAGNIGHDPHMLYTLSAVQILLILDADIPHADSIAQYVAALQQKDGSFAGDQWGEVDTRFTYCALNCLSLLRRLDLIDVPAAMSFVSRCRNFDGGFGAVPGAESHSGQIFVCVASLCIGNAMEMCDPGVLGWWLAERQTGGGGLNGRPEKKPDVCYSWWVLSSLSMLERLEWIDAVALGEFVLKCQDVEDGGISDRPGNLADPFHTFFGIAALSLLGYKPLQGIDPVYAMPVRVVERLGIGKKYQKK